MTTHLILGTGAVGSALANHLAHQGHDVRAVNRSGVRGDLAPEVILARGDVLDPEFTATAFAGVDVIHQVTQPAYHRWEEEFHALQRAVLDAAARAGASVVLADNLYPYGPPRGKTITAATPENPTTRKGRVRKELAEQALAAHASGDVRVALTRPANYVGAGYALFRTLVLDRVAAGKPARGLGRADQPRSFAYVPDVARAMAAVAESEHGWGRAWITPAMTPITQQELVERIGQAMGHSKPASMAALRGAPLRLAAIFSPLLREGIEMGYEFDEPFVVDSSEFTKAFGIEPTTWDDAVEQMVESVTVPA